MTEQPERRRDGTAMLHLISEIHRDVKSMQADLSEHVANETVEIAAEIKRLMAEAFPEGDSVTHRKRHEMELKQAQARTEFWQDMARSVSRWGLIGFVGWLVYAAWKALLQGPQ